MPIPLLKGSGARRARRAGAYFDQKLGEFLLPYDVVRTSADPQVTLLSFRDRTYRAAADLAGRDCDTLEYPLGSRGDRGRGEGEFQREATRSFAIEVIGQEAWTHQKLA
jgi:uncharacterized protein DUF5996